MADENPIGDLLDDESFLENPDKLGPPHFFSGESSLKHSATTDTLDSVLLETSQFEDDILQDDLSFTIDKNEETVDEDQNAPKENAGGQDSHENPEHASANADGSSLQKVTMGTDEVDEVHPHDGGNSNNSNHKSPVKISSYFTAGEESDPFGQVFDQINEQNIESPTKDSLGLQEEPVISNTETDDIEQAVNSALQNVDDSDDKVEEKIHHHENLEARLSHEEPESVDFQVVQEDSNINIMEASLQVIDDKEHFEHFTAEADDEVEQEFGLSMSPANKTLSDKLGKMHITDTIPINKVDKGVSYERQFSASSNHSGSYLGMSADQLLTNPSPVHQSYQGTSILPTTLSPIHQIQTTDNQTESQVSVSSEGAQQRNTSGSYEEILTPNMAATGVVSAFQTLTDTDADDPFSASLNMSDSDRQHDAWLPSEATRQTLVTIATSAPGSYIPAVEQLSTPGIIVDEPQGDPVRDLVHRYMGEQEAIKRQILTVDIVSEDIIGLKKLMDGGCYRSAIELTARLLTTAGQGTGKAGEITQHTPGTLQLWFCRLGLMMKLKLYNIVESEIQAFQNLDTPDLYYEFYPHIYPGRRGSMVPFGMRVLHAEMPHYHGRSQEALDRLHYCLAVAQKIIKNLDDGMCEDGSAVEISEESRRASRELWCKREIQILYLIGNTFLAIKDYEAAMTVYEALLVKDPLCKSALLSGIGLIYLQMGNVTKATDYFNQSEVLTDKSDNKLNCRTFINKGLEQMCMNNFTEAYSHFKKAVECDPSNASAVNNMAVCSLYLGKLRDALKTLEVMVHEDPAYNLHEGILFNLCTLYELESSRALHKKQALLDLVSRHKGDGFPVACLKMA